MLRREESAQRGRLFAQSVPTYQPSPLGWLVCRRSLFLFPLRATPTLSPHAAMPPAHAVNLLPASRLQLHLGTEFAHQSAPPIAVESRHELVGETDWHITSANPGSLPRPDNVASWRDILALPRLRFLDAPCRGSTVPGLAMPHSQLSMPPGCHS